MEKEIKELIELLTKNMNVDITGQLNFVGSLFENDQDARLLIQKLYDIYI